MIIDGCAIPPILDLAQSESGGPGAVLCPSSLPDPHVTPLPTGFAFCLLLCASAQAAEPAAPKASAQPSRPWTAQLRLRHEFVDDAAFANHANADTARLRIGYNPKWGRGFGAMLEAEAVAELGDLFNSGANRQTAYPVVSDARAAELNQAWLDWTGERARVRLGRQKLLLDNQRFIGNVGWRQNEQTFDAVSGGLRLGRNTQVQAIWLDRVHRVAGDHAIDPLARERRLDGRLLRIEQPLPLGALVGYGYWIDDRDVPAAASRTVGLRWSGMRKHGDWAWGGSVEAARQSGHADADVGHADYLLLEPRLDWSGTTFKLGYERLGAGTTRSFQTPLATLHAFNGWADAFLTTPTAGLQDRYAGVQRGFDWGGHKGRWEVAFHDFRADRGGSGYGREWDASLGLTLRPGLDALVKVADYRSDGFARDIRKAWLQLEWAY